MNLFQSFIGVIFSIGFISVLLLFAWYVALPVLLIVLMLGLFNFLTGKPIFKTYRFTDTLNRYRPQTRRQARPKTPPHSNEKIIDVDYTELP